MTPDLQPVTSALTEVVRGVRGDQLALPTPTGGITVAELLDHIDSLSVAFAAAGTKEVRADLGRPPVPDASRLGPDWRDRLPARLEELAQAWRPAAAWAGTAQVGGLVLPAQVAGASAVNEVVVHGWDLAVATGQSFPGDEPALAEPLGVAYAWVRSVAEQNPDGTPGLFGPAVPVPDDAPLMHRLLGLTGRHPDWQPG